MPEPVPLLDGEELAIARARWRDWCLQWAASTGRTEVALEAAIDALQAGLSADAVAALVRMRLGFAVSEDLDVLARERWHCQQARWEIGAIFKRGALPARYAQRLDDGYVARLRQLDLAGTRLEAGAPAAAPAAVAATAAVAAAVPAPAPPPPPPGPSISLRALLADHSVVILASLGAFLLVVATVLFELYGTAGLGGSWRLGAVAALTLVFALAGYFALRNPRLRTVGHIYVGLAAVLLPLVGVAAWTFLDLRRQGITVDQAVAVTGAACAVVYGLLALRLGLRAYADLAGLAIFVATWGLAGAVVGEARRPVGLALLPAVYAAVQRAARGAEFRDYRWFGHGAAAFAVVAGAAVGVTQQWTATLTLTAAGVAYLAWQAIAAHRSRAWIGEALLVVAAGALVAEWGTDHLHFLLPLVLGLPAIVLARGARRLGPLSRYEAHPAHLHLAVFVGLVTALAESDRVASAAPIAFGLWIIAALYALDFAVKPTAASGHPLRAAIPIALALTGETLELGAWTSSLVAVAGFVYLAPAVIQSQTAWAQLLRRDATLFFYGALLVAVVEAREGSIDPGHWALPVALGVWTAVFALAGELKLARFGGFSARVLFSGGWFLGIEAAGARDWRGPLDAVLPLIHTGLAQVRGGAAAATREQRRWLVHATGAVAIGLCLMGSSARLDLRLAAAFGLLAAAYWWRSLVARAIETPVLAWTALALAAVFASRAEVQVAWQGGAMAAAGLALAAGWIAARRLPALREALDRPAMPALGVLAALGLVVSLSLNPFPSWPVTAAAALLAAVLLAWWTQARESAQLAPWLRSGAAAMAVATYLLAAGTLRLPVPVIGIGAVAIAAAHLAWAMRARSVIEALYAGGAMASMTVAVYFWSYGTPGAAGVAELVVLALLWVALAERRQLSWLLVPAVLALLPAVDAGLLATGYRSVPGAEESAYAALAAAVGVVSLTVRTVRPRDWAYALQAPALIPAAGAVLGAYANLHPDVAAAALLAFGAIVYVAGDQDRQPWFLPFAVAAVLAGLFTLLGSRSADTLAYPAALGAVGAVTWGAGALTGGADERAHPLVTMHRILGLSLLVVAALAGFAFPDRTGPRSLGGALALVALEVTGLLLWADAQLYRRPQNLYLAVLAASAGGCFVARELGLDSWELAPPGLAVIGCAVRLRTERRFSVDATLRQAATAVGMVMVMGWATVETVLGSGGWLVVLLVEGVLAVAAGITLRSRVLLVGGAVALALVSLRALVTVAAAGYLFVAFGAVALTLLVAAAGLALGRDRLGPTAGGLREQLSHWE